jgi:hypothetical protein
MDIRVLRSGSDRPSGGDQTMIDKIAASTIYSKRWVIDILLLILLISLSVLLVGTRSTYNQTLLVGKQDQTILEQIKSCTDPQGVCAKRGTQTAAQAVTQINSISILAAFCASKTPPPVSASAIKQCVDAELKK